MVSTSQLDSVFIKSLKRELVNYTPVWLMRQAGRYQKEYRDIRSRVGFLELCKSPELACEVTVMAVEQLGVDAGIIFADILLPLEPMGLGLRFEKGGGPVLDNPIQAVKDVEALQEVVPERDLDYVLQAIALTARALDGKTPLIGFAGAPFTLASYAIEGGGSRNYERTKRLMYNEKEAWDALMRRLSSLTGAYLIAQIKAGASAVQIFDSWVGCLSPSDYSTYVLPHMKELIAAVKGRAPIIYFGTMTSGLLPLMSQTDAEVIGVDWRIDLDEGWRLIGEKGIQGNLDPIVLQSDRDEIKRQTKIILDKAAGRAGHVFNLGHGVLPETPPDNVKYLVEIVHILSGRS
ncbi:MAG: uroporphyrinogen decarboxylase [Candidatus Obscuribacterales bacterium]|nr:uroporphyrinogen decarboxylase [Candidatus Obscuribacterales bacterium]